MKRKHSKIRENDQELSFQSVAFPVGDLQQVEGFQVEDVLDVYQYLNSVQKEADIVSTTFTTERLLTSQTVGKAEHQNIDNEEARIPGHGEFVFELKLWQQEFLNDFLELKTQIAHQIDSISEEEQSWTPPANVSGWRKYVMELPPPPFAVIYHFDHTTAIKLMVYFSSWLSSTTNDNFSRWIYSLFVRIDCLLDHNDCAIIRNLGRKAVKLLAKPDQYSDTCSYTFEFIIVIVNKYYKQNDIMSIDHGNRIHT